MQTITIRNRSYTFTPHADPSLDGHAVRHIGTLTNARGQFAGWVFEMASTGNRLVLGGPWSRYTGEEREALAGLTL